MSSKPVVAMVLSQNVHEMMFSQEDLEVLGREARIVGPPQNCTREEAAKLLPEATIAVAGWGSPRFDAELLAAAPKLRLIAYSAGSIRPVVSDAVYDRGIRITTSAASNALPVAQYSVAMIVALLKQVPWLSKMYARGDAEYRQRKQICRELQDTTVGVIAASRVGRHVIRLLHGYPRVRVKVYDPHLSPGDAAELRAERASLEDVCRCEVVTVHAPNLPQTRQMLNARTLALLPDHAVLVNTSRGALIDEQALVAEVRRRPLYVLLDVTDPEPPAPDSPLRSEPNIILTPHIAGATKQGRLDMGHMAIEETLRFLRGEPLRHEVTREMLPTQA